MDLLNPERPLDRLRSRRLAYEHAHGDRTEHAQALQASINRAEVELGNLVHRIDRDVTLKDLFRKLTFEVEMGKGSFKLQSTMMR